MQIKFIATQDEKLNVLYDAMCSGIGMTERYAIVRTTAKHYKMASKSLVDDACDVDVLLQVIKNGGAITVKSYQDNKRGKITIESLNKNWDAVPFKTMRRLIDGDDDAFDGDAFLQSIAFGSVLFG
jgi:hypothetical protein